MAKTLASPFKPRFRPKGFYVPPLDLPQSRFSSKQGLCRFRIGLPVGCKMQQPTRLQPIRHPADERRLDESSLVVPLFRPGVREENSDSSNRCRSKTGFKNVFRPSLRNFHVRDVTCCEPIEQSTDPGRIDFYSEQIPVRLLFTPVNKRIPCPESDLHA